MGESKKVGLKLLSTGVPGLDEVLGGGLPEYSFNLIAGPPGAGKTTLIQQLAFADALLDKIVQTVKQVNPSIVVVDSFRTMLRTNASLAADRGHPEAFLQRLGLHLASWQITSFLIGEYGESEMQDNPVLTVADGI